MSLWRRRAINYLATRSNNTTGYKGVVEHKNGFKRHERLTARMFTSACMIRRSRRRYYAKHAAGEVVRPAAPEVEVKEAEGYQLFSRRRVRPVTWVCLSKMEGS